MSLPFRRIAVMHSECIARGGAERKLFIYSAMLAAHSQVTIYCGNFDAQKTFSEYIGSTPVVAFKHRNIVEKGLSLLRMAWAVRHADLLICNNYPSNLSAALAKRLFRKPVIWFCNEPQLHLVTNSKKPNWLLSLLKTVEKWAITPFEIVIANSRYTAETVQNIYQKKARVIHSGLDLSRYTNLPPKHSSPNKELILVSRIEAHKNIDCAIRMMRQIAEIHPSVRLTVIGTGTQLRTYQESAIGLPVQFLGSVSEETKIAQLSGADVFIFPTHDEPLGVAPIEAMAAGLPVVAFRSGGVCETVVNEKTGYLVENEAEFIDKTIALLTAPELAAEMGQNAARHAHQEFSQEQMCARLVDAIEGASLRW